MSFACRRTRGRKRVRETWERMERGRKEEKREERGRKEIKTQDLVCITLPGSF